MLRPLVQLFAIGLLATGCLFARAADVDRPFVSPMITDNMVLQRGAIDAVWGWTTPGTPVTVEMNHHSEKVKADASGKWMAHVGPFPAGGPYKLSISGPEKAEFSNVMMGDVWICSGQSNMEFGIGNGNEAQKEIAAANFPNIRLFTVEKHIALTPQTTCKGHWDVCTPTSVSSGGWNGFSAVGYFFGRTLYEKLHVPIGLIHTSWGGTPAEAWTSYSSLDAMGDFSDRLYDLKHHEFLPELTAKISSNPNYSTVLYNGMIAPIIPFGIKGAIWYQGESNAGRAYQYRTLLPTMIKDWRASFGEGDFSFYIVQLANFTPVNPNPGDSDWAELREAQLMTAETLPNTWLAVTDDIGDAADIHPKDKQDVGKRLALCALARDYGEKIEYSGPIYRSMEKVLGGIKLTFDHVGDGVISKDGGPLKGFAIAGPDKKWMWADAQIMHNAIIVSSPKVQFPVAVRYAWANNPIANLYNKEGLPASPFRTDDWPGVTAGRK